MAESSVDQAVAAAEQLHQAGRVREAEAAYRSIVEKHPYNADALHGLGAIAHESGRHDVAVELIQKAIKLKPDVAAYHGNLGLAMRGLGKLDESIVHLKRAVELAPKMAQAHNNLGVALEAKGQMQEALECLCLAVQLSPNDAEAYSNLGGVLFRRGELQAAVGALTLSIHFNPQHAVAHNNLGSVLREMGRFDEAFACFGKAIELKPDLALAHYNRGNVLLQQAKWDDAATAYQTAIRLRPEFYEAHNNLGNVFKSQGLLDEAIACYREAMKLAPHNAACHSNLCLSLHYHPKSTATSIAEELRRFRRQHAKPLKSQIQPHQNNRDPNRKLRVGYVSTDFRDHACARFIMPLLEHHDREQVEAICYAHVPNPDNITQLLQSRADLWRDIARMSDEQAAQQIRDDAIDVLVDLNLHTSGNRMLIFARKPAPVQVTWLGYPGPSGLDTIDYRISDPYLDPKGERDPFLCERVLRLPDSFWCYDPLGDGPAENSLPALERKSITFGCLNGPHKINGQVLALWAKILAKLPDSRLLLSSIPGSHCQKIVDTLAKHGVVSSRVQFVTPCPREQYLELYHQIDIALDTFPFNGGTTTMDAFWMGVPVITLAGKMPASRSGVSIATNLGLAELVAKDPAWFVSIATELARDLSWLSELRATLRDRMTASPLMNRMRFAHNMEKAYRKMWQMYCERPEPAENAGGVTSAD